MPARRRRSPPRGPAAVASIPKPSSASFELSVCGACILDAAARPFREHGDGWQGLALQVLEECSTAGRDIADPVGDPVLGDRRQRVAAAGDRERAASRRARHRQRQVVRALREWFELEHAERPIPYARARIVDRVLVRLGARGSVVGAHFYWQADVYTATR